MENAKINVTMTGKEYIQVTKEQEIREHLRAREFREWLTKYRWIFIFGISAVLLFMVYISSIQKEYVIDNNVVRTNVFGLVVPETYVLIFICLVGFAMAIHGFAIIRR